MPPTARPRLTMTHILSVLTCPLLSFEPSSQGLYGVDADRWTDPIPRRAFGIDRGALLARAHAATGRHRHMEGCVRRAQRYRLCTDPRGLRACAPGARGAVRAAELA